jgi:predicted MFS family arabinose efflux permease
MEPVNAHLGKPQEHSPWAHLYNTVKVPHHLLAFATTALLTTGGFMLMPFSSAYIVNNLGIDMAHLPTVYLVTGICTIFAGPMIGRITDKQGKFPVFLFGTIVSMVTVVIYTHLGKIPLVALVVLNAVMFVGIFSRMIPFQALAASIPPPTQRGAFNAISASLQQLAGGVASVVAGHIVSQGADGRLEHFDVIGYVMVATSLGSLILVRLLDQRALPHTTAA